MPDQQLVEKSMELRHAYSSLIKGGECMYTHIYMHTGTFGVPRWGCAEISTYVHTHACNKSVCVYLLFW
jgi:hypothetical protein